MIVIAFLVLSQSASPKAVLERYAAYRTANPAVSADWTATYSGREVATGTVSVQGAKRLLFKMNEGQNTYSLSETELGGIELSGADGVYDEFPAQPMVVMPRSRISSADEYIPNAFLRPMLFQQGMQYKFEGSSLVGGVNVDEVSWSIHAQGALIYFKVSIDGVGKVLRLTRVVMGDEMPGVPGAPKKAAQGSVDQTHAMVWNFSNYRSDKSAGLSTYYTPLPKGFVPYAIPVSSAVNLAVDTIFPATPWNDKGRMKWHEGNRIEESRGQLTDKEEEGDHARNAESHI